LLPTSKKINAKNKNGTFKINIFEPDSPVGCLRQHFSIKVEAAPKSLKNSKIGVLVSA